MARVLQSPSPALPDLQMSQSSVMLAAVLGGFVVYLMMNQKLAAYWSILLGGSSSATPAASTPQSQPFGSQGPSSPLYQGGGPAPSGGGIVPGPGGTLQLNPGAPLFGGSP